MRIALLFFVLTLPLGAQSGVDLKAIDKSADPCVDFYQYACGTWAKDHPIPGDQSSYSRFSELAEHNQTVLRGILEKAADPANKNRDKIDQEIGDFYAACMDEKGIEQRGIEPLRHFAEDIGGIQDKKSLAVFVAGRHMEGTGMFFGFGSGADAKDSRHEIANISQGGLTLPDRDYYLRTDPKSVELRKAYQEHVAKMFAIAGYPPDVAAAQAQAVLNVETALAKVAMDRVSLRNPNARYHKLPVSELTKLAPDFDWTAYFATLKTPAFTELNITSPAYIEGLEGVLKTSTPEELHAYMGWHILNAAAPLLPKALADEDFHFNGTILTGAKEQRPRWKRCVALTDRALGDALGKKYVEQAFSEQGKERTLKMVGEIEKEMAKDISSVAWMSPATKDQALTKLHKVANKIGYPDQWKDYSSLTISPTDPLNNATVTAAFRIRRNLDRIGKPVDRTEWNMTPPTVNAYYQPTNNDINFPAGILQPPFYGAGRDEAVNYGAIGAVVGHELTHGFDDSGRQFDGDGNLKDWWSASDAEAFKQRADCIVEEYSAFEATGDVHLNGRLTLGENSADNGGIRLAYMAMMDDLASKVKVDGYTPQQRFFLGYAQIWCGNATEQALRLQAQTNPHSPGKYRVDGVVSNMPEFSEAFACQAGQPMNKPKEKACRVW
jgi:endothelin-converting enzyme/putative endopeptidase